MLYPPKDQTGSQPNYRQAAKSLYNIQQHRQCNLESPQFNEALKRIKKALNNF